MRMLEKKEENDDAAEVTWEDQQRINSFSKLNTRIRTIEAKLEELRQEKEALDDLSTELELTDEDDPVLYKIGETFLQISHAQAMKRLERDHEVIAHRLGELSTQADECEKGMKGLKIVLYAKFGNAINLDE